MSSLVMKIKHIIGDLLLPKINLSSFNNLKRARQLNGYYSEIISRRDVEIANLHLTIEQKNKEIEIQKVALSDASSKIINEMNLDRIKLRWELTDAIDQVRYRDIQISCRICGFSGKICSFEKQISYCRFGGGRLERYQCPQCGVIFGPLKMLLLDEAELAEDYKYHYLSYSEGDSTPLEMKAFYSLSPKKDGIYLNYGAGSWSRTLDLAHKDGFQLYGYEPYANVQSDYMLSNYELSKMKFDGIISNNLIEHLQDPIRFFMDMRKMLKDPMCMMAHSTPCYEYSYEFTRFHLHFFTGDSIKYICEKVGMRVVNIERDKSLDYINYVYQFNE